MDEWDLSHAVWGRLLSLSLPSGDDRYLNLSSQKRPIVRNLRGNCSVRRSGTTSRSNVVLVFCLRMRRFPLSRSSSYHIRGNEMNWVGSSDYMTVFTSFTRASFLNIRADQSSSWLISFMYSFCLSIAFAKCPKMAILRHLFNILFF